MDKHIGLHLADGGIEPQYLFAILKSFYDSGHARPKLFIKLQQTVIAAMPHLDVNELCAIVRLYVEMDVQQATFYEETAKYLESNLSKLDEGGLLNALISFKQADTQKQLRIVNDLE